MRRISEEAARAQLEHYRKHRERQEAERKVAECNGDTAIPWPWQQGVINCTGINPAGHVCWGYPEGYLFGKPVAVTGFGEDLLRLLGVLQEDDL